MRWIYDACGNADLEGVAFAERGVSAILGHVDLSSAPRDAADAATCLLGRLVRELRMAMRGMTGLRGKPVLAAFLRKAVLPAGHAAPAGAA